MNERAADAKRRQPGLWIKRKKLSMTGLQVYD